MASASPGRSRLGLRSAAPRLHASPSGRESDLEVHSSGINAGGGSQRRLGGTDFSGGIGDQGTIVVDLALAAAGQRLGHQGKRASTEDALGGAATCVVYPTTGVICDPNVTVNPEEMALIRLLAPTFVDPDSIDANAALEDRKRHAAILAHFELHDCQERQRHHDDRRDRVIRQQQPEIATTDVNSEDRLRFQPYDSRRPSTNTRSSAAEPAMDQYNTVKTQTILQLQSDSLAQA